MSSSSDKPMLGGCCVCLDERGWAENPLVYCDGQGCCIAVHQACYGIVTVPSGPWFCGRCESHDTSVKVSCVLCPHQGGAMKRTDSGKWAHVVCALYIPEVEFGNVSSMEPIVLQKIPEERYNKVCFVCEENGREEKSIGACMDCAKSGCKLNFHVTCAQMAGLLCEEAGSSNTTKYCGYCSQHFSKNKKVNPFKSLACSKVYNLASSNNTLTHIPPSVTASLSAESIETEHIVAAPVVSQQNNESSLKPVAENVQPATTSLSSLAEVASDIIQTSCFNTEVTDDKLPNSQNEKNTIAKDDINKKTKRKNIKNSAGSKKPPKIKKVKPNPVVVQESKEIFNNPVTVEDLESAGYAVAPKHSVITLSSFGDSSLEPSHPSDIGETKPSPTTEMSNCDGLMAIEKLINQQKDDVMKFFQEFGTSPNVSSLLKSLHTLRDDNSSLEKSVERMTHRRDQLLAIKARLSVPLKSAQLSRVCLNTAESALSESKPFNTSAHTQQYPSSYPTYFANKP